MSHFAKLNRRKATVMGLLHEARKSVPPKTQRSLDEVRDLVDQICGRGEVAEKRIEELEEWMPMSFDIKCPNCNNDNHVSVPGSGWYKKELEKAKNG